ncbi:AraC family transcriptional regulator [Dyella sp.]|jgi:AraC family transcriptional activator of mtrCDE|uniref:AraC family transcriptional regulator n=1 Tax=Dyella sp. TaxID=1869338 RepID=UPI002BC74003|nr:AraC family transcriptional regulator [Dyella sp.]HTC28021.1 AraC family transcriptional regulator [Dyella sp.]
MYIEHTPALASSPRPLPVEPALESLLSQSMLRVDIVAELQYCGSWFMDEPRYDCGLFHLVGTGECLVESPALTEALQLQAGDLVVFPHGDPHRLSATSDDPTSSTSLICGELHFSSNTMHPLSHALPACFVVRAAHADNVFRSLSTMMVDVANSGLAGRQVLLNKLADTLFTLAICDFAQRQTDHRGLFAALADTRICKVLRAVHENPGHAWTMQCMAALACMSRSAFAERFAQLMKVPPMQYVTQWRVSVAERLLRDRQLSVASIAEQLGYSSEAAFRRLFKRVSGVCPGHIRSQDQDYLLN